MSMVDITNPDYYKKVRNSTATLYQKNLRIINTKVLQAKDPDLFDVSKMDLDMVDTIMKWLADNYKPNTQLTFHRTLCKFAELADFPFEVYMKLKDIKIDPERNNKIDNDWKQKLNNIDKSNNRNLHILKTIILNLGAIRLCEVIKTKINNYDDDWNTIDTNKKIWKFVPNATKNKRDVEIQLSDEFVNELQKHLLNGCPYLTVGKDLRPYDSSHSLSALFKKAVGINYQTVRGSESYSHNLGKTMDQVKEKCKVLGHQPRTNAENYTEHKPKIKVKVPKSKIKVKVKKRVNNQYEGFPLEP